VKKTRTIAFCEKYMREYAQSPHLFEVERLRNAIAFEQSAKENTWKAYKTFMETYPKADDMPTAKERYELLLFQDMTQGNSIDDYAKFIEKFPESPYVEQAENSIYAKSTRSGSIRDYYAFIKRFPKNHNVDAAWRNMYVLSTSDFSPASIAEFRLEYPDYPYKDEVIKDFDLSRTSFYPSKSGELWGYIDSLGNEMIPFGYESAEAFSEGLAAVSINGKYGFLNKNGRMTIQPNYDEVQAFKGVYAVVSVGEKSGLIHKTGKEIVPIVYDEVDDEMSGQVVEGEFFIGRAGDFQCHIMAEPGGHGHARALAAVGQPGAGAAAVFRSNEKILRL
jgi:hypothetical protein